MTFQYSTWDDPSQAARPTLVADLGGTGKVNAPNRAPNRTTQPNADDWNQLVAQAAALGAVCPAAILLVQGGATPSITLLMSARTALLPSDFAISRAAAGDVTITPPAAKLPVSNVPPTVSQADDTEIDRLRCFLSSGAYRVKSKLGASGTDCSFVLVIY